MDYYEKLLSECKASGRVEYIGSTVCGRRIPLVRTGRGRVDTLIVGATHAREHITVELIKSLFFATEYSFDVIPCLNIDGVMLCRDGIGTIPSAKDRKYLIDINGGEDFSLWKANASAVDLNVNFDAHWGEGDNNVFFPAPSDYVGRRAESEPETRAVSELMKSRNYSQVIAYHAKGEVVYWGFGNNFFHYAEAKRYADSMGYRLTTAYGSAGGLKDKYCLTSDGLGLTVEIGNDKFSHPYPEKELPNLINQHKESVRLLYENGIVVAKKRGADGVGYKGS